MAVALYKNANAAQGAAMARPLTAGSLRLGWSEAGSGQAEHRADALNGCAARLGCERAARPEARANRSAFP